jgi:hypothetical protein
LYRYPCPVTQPTSNERRSSLDLLRGCSSLLIASHLIACLSRVDPAPTLPPHLIQFDSIQFSSIHTHSWRRGLITLLLLHFFLQEVGGWQFGNSLGISWLGYSARVGWLGGGSLMHVHVACATYSERDMALLHCRGTGHILFKRGCVGYRSSWLHCGSVRWHRWLGHGM